MTTERISDGLIRHLDRIRKENDQPSMMSYSQDNRATSPPRRDLKPIGSTAVIPQLDYGSSVGNSTLYNERSLFPFNTPIGTKASSLYTSAQQQQQRPFPNSNTLPKPQQHLQEQQQRTQHNARNTRTLGSKPSLAAMQWLNSGSWTESNASGSRAGSTATSMTDETMTTEEEEAEEEDYLPPRPNDDEPIVPIGFMQRETKPDEWHVHPAHSIVLSLLRDRGVSERTHGDIVDYHMATRFLDSLVMLMHGCYFVKYARKRSPPKERFLCLQVWSDHLLRPVPHLCWYIHQHSAQIIDKVSFHNLVGITRGISSHAFKRHLVTNNIIKGSYAGGHKTRLPTTGCFTLWFYDPRSCRPRSVDLLTTNEDTLNLWLTTCQGILSVNSVAVSGAKDPLGEMARLLALAQKALRDSDDADDYD